MTSDSIKPPEQRYNYSNALTGLVELIKSEGVKGLTRGLGANTVRCFLSLVEMTLTYQKVRAVLMNVCPLSLSFLYVDVNVLMPMLYRPHK
jgi:solute carrier family 25 (mitochondrial dicarboxylate transporter), member 10